MLNGLQTFPQTSRLADQFDSRLVANNVNLAIDRQAIDLKQQGCVLPCHPISGVSVLTTISLAKANKIIKTAFATAESMKLNPLGICVYDAGGNLKAFQLQDGASIGRFAIASGKVRGALATGKGSRWMNAQAESRPHFLAGLASVVEGGVVPVAGGVLARDKKGDIVGAVGISGDTSDNDEACAVAAIEACGFVADIG